MTNLDYRPEYRRNLPHLQPEGAKFFITFRLKDSIPISVLEQWSKEKEGLYLELNHLEGSDRQDEFYKAQKKQFGQLDRYLDKAESGPTWLKNPEVAQILWDSLHHRDGKIYQLDVFTIMSNHVHFVFEPFKNENGEYHALQGIFHSLKRFTAARANEVLNRTGNRFWQPESYDHIIRDEAEWHRIMNYILMNPVKAGLVDDWRDWPWTYCRFE